jgi:5-amino-6-(5-phospho-D-ribitylamino)uracil phosphatase
MHTSGQQPSVVPGQGRSPGPTGGQPSSVGPIKLIAIDLDGTLLTSDKRVSKKTVRALQGISKELRVVIASARPPRSVRQVYQILKLDTWQINYNGAMIWDEPNKTAVFHRPLAGKLVLRMIQAAREMSPQVLVSCEILDRWYTDGIDERYLTETARTFKPDVVAPCETFCNQPITKLMLLGEPKMLSRLEVMLLKRFSNDVTIVQTDRDLLQIMDRHVSKAVALRTTAEHYGIPPEQIMAIGDAPNDVGMLQYAGVGVAMDNAHPIAKKVADWIAPSNDDHGVHAAMVRYGLCK